MNPISRETFNQMHGRDKLGVLFDLTSCTCEKVDKLEKKLNRKIWFDKATSLFGGVIGGLAANIFKVFS